MGFSFFLCYWYIRLILESILEVFLLGGNAINGLLKFWSVFNHKRSNYKQNQTRGALLPSASKMVINLLFCD